MGEAWSCSEGDVITIETRTTNLPIVRLAGRIIQAQRLATIKEGFLGEYEFLIDTWAGRTALQVHDGTAQSAVMLEIRPNHRKLGENEFDAMLHELAQRSSNILWGLSPGAGRGMTSSPSPAVVHPAVIASQLPLLERLLTIFMVDPPRVTLRRREARPLDLTRRADLATLRWLGRKPLFLEALRGNAIAAGHTNPRAPIDQPTTNTSVDHPITRYFAYLLRCLSLRLRKSAATLRSGSGRIFRDIAVEEHAHALASELDLAIARIDKHLSSRPFREVLAAPPNETALQLLGDHPLFTAIHRICQLLLYPGLAYGPDGNIYSALKHTYDLFELFVLFRMIDELPKQLGASWTTEASRSGSYKGREERPEDRAAWLFRGPDGLTLELRYQQWFSRAKSPPDNRMFTSLSGVNIPDYVLILRRNRVLISWVIIDAKYRSGRQAVDQGLGDVHRYRDALRVRGARAQGAFVIVPRLQDESAVYSTKDFHEQHAFGVLQLYSDGWLDPVGNLLRQV